MANRLGRAPLDRFNEKYVVEGDCWRWIGADTGKGHKLRYGIFYDSASRRRMLAHRWSYQQFVGPIPAGLEIDHACRNPLCVNPAHLEPVTRRVNVMRGTSPNARNRAKTHCINGHELTQENCYQTKWPRFRECKHCARVAQRQRYARKRLQTNSLASAERNAQALRKAIEELS